MPGTRSVSDPSLPSIRKFISPKLSASFLVQPLFGALNREHILSSWCRSASLLFISDLLFLARPLLFSPRPTDLLSACPPNLPFLTCPSTCSSPGLSPGLDVTNARRSAGCWLTATSSASSSPATTRFDRDQFAESDRNEKKKRLHLERVATEVSSSSDPLASGLGIDFSRWIAPSNPFR